MKSSSNQIMDDFAEHKQRLQFTAKFSGNEQTVEFDIHGLLGIRLLYPSPTDVAAVSEQLGPLKKPLLREPDVTIRFVSHLAISSNQYLGSKLERPTEEAFFVFDDRTKRVLARVPFDRVGSPCEIVCQRGLKSVPLFMPILSLAALAKGLVAVHATAFIYRGTGIMMIGQAQSGKTTTLLGFAFDGAEFVGEEWVLIDGDGQAMYGLPRKIELSPSHLETVPEVRRVIKRSRLLAFEGLRHLGRMQTILGKVAGRSFTPHALKAISALQRRVLPKVRPQAIFGSRVSSLIAKPEKVFLLIRHSDPGVEVRLIPAIEMARRVTDLIQNEQAKFIKHYRAFKSAFPERENRCAEESATYQYALLSRALTAKETYTVRHPRTINFSALYAALKPFCESPRKAQCEAECVVP